MLSINRASDRRSHQRSANRPWSWRIWRTPRREVSPFVLNPLEPRILLDGAITGTAFNDLDGDGAQDIGEPGLAGVVVFLDADRDGQMDGGETSVVTDGDGDYAFPSQTEGTYDVRQVVPAGFAQSFPSTMPVGDGVLTFQQVLLDGVGGADGLFNPTSVTVSPDGAHVYVTALTDDSVAAFSRNPVTDELAFVQVLVDGVGGVDGLATARQVVISPDGMHAYTVGETDDAVSVFSRNANTGELTFLQVLKDGVGGVDGLDGARSIAVSADGQSVYAVGFEDDALSVFSRDANTGLLTFEQVLRDNIGGADGLFEPRGVDVSPDGMTVYTAARGDDAVGVFSRDPNTSLLTFVEIVRNGQNDSGGTLVQGIQHIQSVQVSPDGRNVYTTSQDSHAVSVFDRDTDTGVLTFAQVLVDGAGGVDGIFDATYADVSPDGASVYVASDDEDTVAVFSRDTDTGLLTFVNTVVDGAGGVNGLDFPVSIDSSPDGSQVYVVGLLDNGLARFDRNGGGAPPGAHRVFVGDADVNGLNFGNEPLLPFVTIAANDDSASEDGGIGQFTVTRSGDTGAPLTVLYDIGGTATNTDDYTTLSGMVQIPTGFASATIDLVPVDDGEVEGAESVELTITANAAYEIGDPAMATVNIADNDAPTGSISGLKFADIDGDGVRDPGDDGLPGFVIYLDANNNGVLDPGETNVTTDASGQYTFPDLDAGSYTVAEVQQQDFEQTFPSAQPAGSGALTFQQVLRDGVGGVDGLFNPTAVTVSPDGAHVYVTALSGNSVAVFSRNTGTDVLSFVQVLTDGVGGVDGLAQPRSVMVSPDGAHVYVAAEADDAVGVFSRNTNTGELTFEQVVRDGVGGVDGLDGARSVAITPDGTLVIAAGFEEDALAVFTRNPGTGQLAFQQVVRDNVGGADGLFKVRSVAVSPDGQNVYTAGRDDHAIGVFTINSGTDMLAFEQVLREGTDDGAGHIIDGLQDVQAVAVSPDGGSVYAVSNSDQSVAHFSRNAADGRLVFEHVIKDGAGGVDGLGGATFVTVSPDSANVYVASETDDAVAMFTRDLQTGDLTFDAAHIDGQGGVDGLDGAIGVAVGPDGTQAYAVGLFDSALARFDREGGAAADGTHLVQLAAGQDVTDINFGNQPIVPSEPGTISGVKFDDDNANGVQDAGEAGLPGFTIYLDANNNGRLDTGETSTVTAADGSYTLINVAEGTHFVREVQQPGLEQTAPSPIYQGDSELDFVQQIRDTIDVDGLLDAWAVVVSADNANVYATASTDDTLLVFERDAVTGELSHVQTLEDGVGGVDGMNTPRSAAVSLDGRHVYVGGEGDDAIAVFERDEQGMLTFVQFVRDGQDDGSGNTVNGLDGVRSVTVSDDGQNVYAASIDDDAVAVFVRNANTGELTFIHFLTDGVAGVDGLFGARSVVVSPDGLHAYVAGRDDNAIAILERDAGDGQLTFIDVIRDGDNAGAVDGLAAVQVVAISPDGKHIYAGSNDDQAMSVFERDANTGLLEFIQVVFDGNDIQLDGATSIAVSPDGGSVYVAAEIDDAVMAFSRDAATGLVTAVEFEEDGQNGVDGLNGVLGVAVSPDGRTVYAAGTLDSSVVVFDRDSDDALAGAHTVVLPGGGAVTDVDFGNSSTLGEIRGVKFDDADGDGFQDSGEGGLGGFTIFLDGNGNGQLDAGEQSTVTAPDGSYAFADLVPGSYTVAEVQQTGFDQTFPAPTFVTERVSRPNLGGQSNSNSLEPGVSDPGRFVAFSSFASNLVSTDNNNASDVFLFDRQTHVVERVSVGTGRTQANDSSFEGQVSADGDRIVFLSTATNLVPGADDGTRHIYVFERSTNLTRLVSASNSGQPGDRNSFSPAISADGRFVAFQSIAENLVPNDNNQAGDIFVYDILNETIERVSVGPGGVEADEQSGRPAISADGRFVSFHSDAENLVDHDMNDSRDVFVHDRLTGTTEIVSILPDGTQGTNTGSATDGDSRNSKISADGRFIVFHSDSTEFFPGISGDGALVYLFDRATGRLELASITEGGVPANDDSRDPDISPDGRYVTYESFATNLDPAATGGTRQVFVYDRLTGLTRLASVGTDQSEGNNSSGDAAISDGPSVAFESSATNLVNGDTNAQIDIFVQSVVPGVHAIDLQPQQVVTDADFGNFDANPAFAEVNIVSKDNVASEDGDTGSFRITRDARTETDLTVQYTVTGTATNGTDYQTIDGTAIIPAGQFVVTVNVIPIDDFDIEGTEFVTLTLTPDAAFVIGPDTGATVSIRDNEGGRIGGTKFDDDNGNGVQDAGELGIAGFTVYLDLNNNLIRDAHEPAAMTDASGHYAFSGLDNATYQVVEEQQPGFAQTFPDPTPGSGQLTFDQTIAQDGLSRVVVSPDGSGLYTLGDDIEVFERDPATGDVTHVQTVEVDLAGFPIMLVTPDGNSLILVTDVIEVFARDASTQELTHIQTIEESDAGNNNLNPTAMAVSPDGTSFYLATIDPLADPQVIELLNFDRDAELGLLTFKRVVPLPESPELLSVRGIEVSPDSRRVAVLSVGLSLFDFERDPANGELTFDQVFRNSTVPSSLAMSPDGRSLYAGGQRTDLPPREGSIVSYVRNPISGELSRTDGPGIFGGFGDLTNFSHATFMEMSPDGVNLYVFDAFTEHLFTFARDPQSGALTLTEDLFVTAAIGQDDVNDMVISADGRQLYLVGADNGTYLATFQRDGGGTPPGTHRVVIDDDNRLVDNADFGNRSQLGAIEGVKFADENGNGQQDAEDLPVADWEVFLDANRNGVLDDGEPTTTTDAQGRYRFDGLPTGTYSVAEVPQPGWLQTAPSTDGPEGVELAFLSETGIPRSDQPKPSVSGDGRFVVFASDRADLVPNDHNVATDVFLLDRATNLIERISISTDGGNADGRSNSPVLSDDGRYVVYASDATNLVSNDNNDATDVFLYDRETGITEIVSLSTGGAQGDFSSGLPDVSADGRYVTFTSIANNLSTQDDNNFANIFVRDRETGLTDLVSIGFDGSPAEGNSMLSRISDDGRHVSFYSIAENIVAGSTDFANIFVFDRDTRTAELASFDAPGFVDVYHDISGDGGFVAFSASPFEGLSVSQDLFTDVFVYDRQNMTHQAVSAAGVGADPDQQVSYPRLSTDGRLLTVSSNIAGLAPNDANTDFDIYRYDRVNESIERLSNDANGFAADGLSIFSDISADGRHVVFFSASGELSDPPRFDDDFALFAHSPQPAGNHSVTLEPRQVVGDADFGNQPQFGSIAGVKFRDDNGDGVQDAGEPGLADVTVFLDLNNNGVLDVDEPSTVTDADGNYAFNDLLPGPYIVVEETVAGFEQTHPGQAGSAAPIQRVSISTTGGDTDGESLILDVSDDGRFTLFLSAASNLVDNDDHEGFDYFIFDRQTGTNQLIAPVPFGYFVRQAGLSGDGRYAALFVDTEDLGFDSDPSLDVAVFDLETGTFELIGDSFSDDRRALINQNPTISDDGRFVGFNSIQVDDQNEQHVEVWIHDRTTGEKQLASPRVFGDRTNAFAYDPRFSGDGRYLMYGTFADNLVFGDNNDNLDVYIFDRFTGDLERIDPTFDGQEPNGFVSSGGISHDGQLIAFETSADNFAADDTNNRNDIYFYNRGTDVVERISNTPDGLPPNSGSFNPSLSDDGRFVAYSSTATNILPGTTNTFADVYVYDRVQQTTVKVTTTPDGGDPTGNSFDLKLSADGRLVSFSSLAGDLVDGDFNNREDVFIAPVPIPFAHVIDVAPRQDVDDADFGNRPEQGTPDVSVSASPTSLSESAGPVRFTFTRTGDTGQPLTVFFTGEGTATSGADYAALPDSVTIAVGQSSFDLDVALVDDGTQEDSETLELRLTENAAYNLTVAGATVTITDDDGGFVPTVSILPITTNGSEDGSVAQVHFTRNGPNDSPLTVMYTLDGDAINGSDYQTLDGSVVIPAGSSTFALDIVPIDDDIDEDGETVIVTLAESPGNYRLGNTTSGSATIADNDNDLPVVNIDATDNLASETGDPGGFTVTRTGDTGQSLTVNYAIGGSATNGVDFTTLSGSVTIPAGASSAPIPIHPFADGVVEAIETVELTLTINPATYLVGTFDRDTVNIVDDDAAIPSVSVLATAPIASEDGTVGEFTVSRSGPTDSALNVFYSVTGTAINSVDYVTLSNFVRIPAGQSSVVIPIDALPDDLEENDETVVLTISPNAPVYNVSNNDSATVTIGEVPLPAEEVARFGKPVGPTKIEIPDAFGNSFDFRLSGDGIGIVLREADGRLSLQFEGTSDRSRVTINNRGNGDGKLHDLLSDGALGNVNARNISFTGDLIVNGRVGAFRALDVDAQHRIEFGGTPFDRPSNYTFGVLTDVTFVSGAPGRLTITAWNDTDPESNPDSLTIPHATNILARRDRRRGIGGTWDADVVMSGIGATRGRTLGNLRVDDGGSNVDILVTGDANNVQFGGPIDNVNINVSGTLNRATLSTATDTDIEAGEARTVRVARWTNGKLVANAARTVQVTDVIEGVDITVANDVNSVQFKEPANDVDITVGGELKRATLDVLTDVNIQGGEVGTARIDQWTNGQFTAASVRTFQVKEDMQGVNVTVTGDPTARSAVNNFKVGGVASAGLMTVVGSTGNLSFGAVGAGFAALVTGEIRQVMSRGSSSGDFSALNIGTVNIGGELLTGTMRAGYSAGPDGLPNTGDDTELGGPAAEIKRITVRGTTPNAETFVAGVFPTKANINRSNFDIDPASDVRFRLIPV